MIVQKMNCLAQLVDEARIAANNLEVLQVGCRLNAQPRVPWLSQDGRCTQYLTTSGCALVRVLYWRFCLWTTVKAVHQWAAQHQQHLRAREGQHCCVGAEALVHLQVSWHPHSQAHFAVLTSDNAFSIFRVHQPTTPEQLFKISPPRSIPTSLSILSLENAPSDELAFVAFTVGSVHAWDPLMVYLLTRYDPTRLWHPRAQPEALQPHLACFLH